MRAAPALLLLAVLVSGTGCGTQGPAEEPGSGVAGSVQLGPQCAVESSDSPCDEKPAAGVTVIVAEQPAGEAYGAGREVARTKTASDGTFEVAVDPGEYVVTAEAGMSCEFMDARVVQGSYTDVSVPCDTGIR